MSAEEDIRKTIAQFANGFDLKDWVLMESALAELITVDFSDLRGPIDSLGHSGLSCKPVSGTLGAASTLADVA